MPNTYTVVVSYNINGGSGSSIPNSSQTDTSNSLRYVNVSVPLSTPSGWTKTGYTLKGWATSSGGGVAYAFGGTYSHQFLYDGTNQSHSVTLYACWQPTTYSVVYNANGGSGAPSSQTKVYNVNLTLSSVKPSRSGYQFKGWATSSSGSVSYQPGGTYSANSNVTLYAIWENNVSTVSIRSGSVGESSVIRITSPVAGTKFTLTYKCGSKSGTIVSNQDGSNTAGGYVDYTWSVPENLAEEGVNSTSVDVTVYCKTFINNSEKGTTNAMKTMSIPNNSTFKPTVNLSSSLVNDNTTINGWGIAVQGFSKIKLTASASAKHNATIKSYTFNGPDFSKAQTTTASSTNVTTGVVVKSGSLTYSVTVTDSRGYTNKVNVSVTVYPYSSPAVKEFNAFRSDSSGEDDPVNGKRITANVKYSFSSCNGNNHATAKLKYKSSSASSYTSWINSAVSNRDYTVGSDLSIALSYDVRVELTDDLDLSTFVQIIRVPLVIGYGFGMYNDRVHFGGPCQIAGFECDWDSRFHGRIFAPNHAQRGFVSALSLSANSNTTKTITFDDEFGISPNVVATLFSTSGYIGDVTISVYSVTESGFKMRLENNNSYSVSVGANWIAIL